MNVKGNKYSIDVKFYEPKNKMKEIIIACHGFGGDKESSTIRDLAEEVNKYDVGVMAFDFPGHGKSEVDADELTILNCMQDINDVENYIKKEYGNIPVSIFATSFGAYISLLNIIKNNKSYKNIILRSPAIKMDEILKNALLRESILEYKKRGYTNLGFERKMKVPYSFLEDLEQNNIIKEYLKKEKLPNINIIQGDMDDIAPIVDTIEFVKQHGDNVELYIVPGANHRMKGIGELEQVINYSKKIMGITK